MNRALEARTAELRAHECDQWRCFQDVAFELWSAAALRSFLAGTAWASLFDHDEPTAAEMRAVIGFALGPEHAAFKPTAFGNHDLEDED